MDTAGLDAVGAHGGVLRIDFPHCGDRYGHCISIIEADGRRIAFLESVEGTASEDWPPSPPLQSLSIEELSPGRRAALLVGMAGRSHWSASIEPVAGEAAFVLDLACRTSQTTPRLGSWYRCIAAGGWQAAVIPLLACTVQSQPEGLSVVPSMAGGPGTIRWKYRVGLSRA